MWVKGKARESSSTNTPLHGPDTIGCAPDPGLLAQTSGGFGLARQNSAASAGGYPSSLSRMGAIPAGQTQAQDGGFGSMGQRKRGLQTRCLSGELIMRSAGYSSPPPAGIERRVASMIPVINHHHNNMHEIGAGSAEAGVPACRPGSGGQCSPAGENSIRAGSSAGQNVMNDPLLGQMSIAAIHTGLATSPGKADTCFITWFSCMHEWHCTFSSYHVSECLYTTSCLEWCCKL
jgi:hypothetical protein